MKRFNLRLLLTMGVGVVLLFVALSYARQKRTVALNESTPVGRLPRIRPDYTGCVIPANIAPMNFLVAEAGSEYCVRIHSASGRHFEVFSRTPRIVIPSRQWKELLSANRGQKLFLDVYAREEGAPWRRFQRVTNTIADDDIDGYLVYRRIPLVYNTWWGMGIYQRNLQNYDEWPIVENMSIGGCCVNCHTFLNNRGDKMIFHVRPGQYDLGMVVIENGVVTRVDTRTKFNPSPAAYICWHPSGKLVAFSANKVRQFFHTARGEIRDVVDLDSNLGIYVLDSRTVLSTRDISRPDRLETFPTWSPDGRYLYFCSAPILWSDRNKVPPEHYQELRYDLMRIGYDLGTGTWGKLETVLSAADTGLSICEPRISPDGRFLLFCMSQYGGFPPFQPSTDLYLMDLKTGQYRPLTCNSDHCDSYHSWSSNSRWIVFSSKRRDGLFTRPYFLYIDENGREHKPFLLPQKDPTFYDSFTELQQLPELIKQPVPVRGEDIARVIRSPISVKGELPITSATPPREPAQLRN